MNNDLISRSALLEAMRKESILHRQAFHIDTKALIQHEEEFSACMRVVCSAPTVDAEVVRHGRWIKENIRVKSYLRLCSVCNKIAYFCGSGCSYVFCPNCGAKMDAEVEGC